MSRNKGIFNIATNLEGLLEAPIDARQVVQLYDDLTDSSTWEDLIYNKVWLYNGALVVVGEDPDITKRGVYYLIDADNYTDEESWIKVIDETIIPENFVIGATNGLQVINDGKIVILGGTLITGTTINADNNDFTLSNINALNIGINSATITDSGDGQGLKYSADYSGDFVNRSLIDKQYVDSGLILKLNVSTFNHYTGITQPILDEAITGATNGLTKNVRNIEFGGDINKSTTITITSNSGTELLINDLRTIHRGIEYSGNYASYFTERSLVDREYVDNEVNKTIMNVTNLGSGSTIGEKLVNDITLKSISGVGNLTVTDDSENIYLGVEHIPQKNKILVVTGNTTLDNEYDTILVNHNSSITIFLPPNPYDGQILKINDVAGNALNNQITLNGNGKIINNTHNYATIETNYGGFEMTYTSNLNNWFVTIKNI